MFTQVFSVGLALLPFVSAAIHDVQVGAGGKNVFDPEAIFADVGDQVVFHFTGKNHSVTQSSLAAPCSLKDGGFDSGFMFVPANQTDNLPTHTITVQDTNPLWVFCAQAANTPNSHCGAGMVFSVNCGADGAPNSFTSFKSAALAIGDQLKAAASSAPPPDSGSSSSAAGGYGGYGSPATQTASAPESAGTANTANNGTSTSSGSQIKVTVGSSNGSLFFDPAHISANPQDTIIFEFHQKNHSVVQSTFDDPCAPMANGLKSDFFNVPDTQTDNFQQWSVTVNDTKPLWFYCRQKTPKSHCGAGMVFAVNSVETSAKSFSSFQQTAQKSGGNSTSASGATGTNDNGAMSPRVLGSGATLVFAALVATLLL